MKNEIEHGIDSDTANSDIAGMENGAPLIKKSGMLSRGLKSIFHGLKLVCQGAWQIIALLLVGAIGLLLITLAFFAFVGFGGFLELIDIALEIVAGKRASYFLVVIATGGVVLFLVIIALIKSSRER